MDYGPLSSRRLFERLLETTGNQSCHARLRFCGCAQSKLGNLEQADYEPRAQWIAAKHNIDKFNGTTVMMLLSFQPKKKCKIREVYYGGHFDLQLFAIRNCVHPVQ